MRTETPPQVRLSEYTPYPFKIEQVRLEFTLAPEETRVVSRLKVVRIGASDAPLKLDGEKLALNRIELDGVPLDRSRLTLNAEELIISDPGDAFDLLIETTISPQSNTELSGLYISGGRFCTQCEAEGFRRITYYPDRPDVLAPYQVRIEANAADVPYLLSNGNPVSSGTLENGRHYAEWNDPHPKPSYLFALVGGDFDRLQDDFTTRSGNKVDLTIYVEKGDAPKAAYAMNALKRSMAWDEDVFGREYDLDVFQIVAVRDFNFGAMENKGLNIFNSAYVLADGDTATDFDFEAIESIVAHEYFHNWTGNRITCRDWFQLCLKEGLTVFRDQEFTQSMRSRAVARIKDVIRLRTRQFPEDAGPLAHPVRPDAYARIDNLYTATVYEKGAELIRMLRLITGDEAFFAGLNRYFEKHDGHAATIEDFIASVQASTDQDLDAFQRWYAQSGTPRVDAKSDYNAARKQLTLTLSQVTHPTPGQPEKHALPIPMRVALFDENGSQLQTRASNIKSNEHLVLLTKSSQTFVFDDVSSKPRPSLNRGFSAPIRLTDDLTEADRSALAGFDTDAFAQWNALQTIARSIMLDTAAGGKTTPDPERVRNYVAAVETSTERAFDNDPAFAALLLHVPSVGELIMDQENADPDTIHTLRQHLRSEVAKKLESSLIRFADSPSSERFSASAEAVSTRALKSAALASLSTLGTDHETLIFRAFQNANTMTERLASLGGLSAIESNAFDRALDSFEAEWSKSPLVMDKWFSVQAGSVRSDIQERLKNLSQHPDFDLKNPNRTRALVASFAMNNPVGFNAADGWGYRFLADMILKVDTLNPALSARLATAFESWRNYSPDRRTHAQEQLERLSDSKLSRNAQDIVSRALVDPEAK